jgi:hypothetical protein
MRFAERPWLLMWIVVVAVWGIETNHRGLEEPQAATA